MEAWECMRGCHTCARKRKSQGLFAFNACAREQFGLRHPVFPQALCHCGNADSLADQAIRIKHIVLNRAYHPIRKEDLGLFTTIVGNYVGKRCGCALSFFAVRAFCSCPNLRRSFYVFNNKDLPFCSWGEASFASKFEAEHGVVHKSRCLRIFIKLMRRRRRRGRHDSADSTGGRSRPVL